MLRARARADDSASARERARAMCARSRYADAVTITCEDYAAMAFDAAEAEDTRYARAVRILR